MSLILLTGGTVLVHGVGDEIKADRLDLLIKDTRIIELAPKIEPQAGYEVINCKGKLISPGFIDTHHHVWQSPMKGLCSDSTFIEYLAIMFAASANFTPQDIFWSNLAGTMESLDAGTTTVLDHSHLNWTKHHSKQALAGTFTSGLRSVYAYSYNMRLEETKPEVKFSSEPLADWVMETLETLAMSSYLMSPDSRVQLGLGFDWFFLPKDVVLGIFDKVRSLGVNIITSHSMLFKTPEGEITLPELLKRYNLLDKRMVLSHCEGAVPADGGLMSQAKAFVSCTPSTELQMAVGPPVCFREEFSEMQGVCSLGVDCQSVTSAYMANEMRLGLQSARGYHNTMSLKKEGKVQSKIAQKVEQAFNMGTIQGARALNMEDDIGSIAVGKKADLVIFDTTSPAMTGAAQVNPVGAIVLHSNVGDIDMVIVDGVIRKRDGKVLPAKKVEWSEQETDFIEKDEIIDWQRIAEEVLMIQRTFIKQLGEYDLEKIGQATSALLGFDK